MRLSIFTGFNHFLTDENEWNIIIDNSCKGKSAVKVSLHPQDNFFVVLTATFYKLPSR